MTIVDCWWGFPGFPCWCAFLNLPPAMWPCGETLDLAHHSFCHVLKHTLMLPLFHIRPSDIVLGLDEKRCVKATSSDGQYSNEPRWKPVTLTIQLITHPISHTHSTGEFLHLIHFLALPCTFPNGSLDNFERSCFKSKRQVCRMLIPHSYFAAKLHCTTLSWSRSTLIPISLCWWAGQAYCILHIGWIGYMVIDKVTWCLWTWFVGIN